MTTRIPALLTVALLALLGLSACGDASEDTAAPASRTAENGDVFNDADVAFATAAIPHHAEAVQMVVLTQGRRLDPAVVRLAEQIRETHVPEVEAMTDLLTAWGEDVPETSLDHVNAGHDHDAEAASDGALAELAAADDGEFQELWLTTMVEHHRRAVEIAQSEVADGEHADTLAMADTIVAAHEADIETMQGLLDY